MILPDGYSDVSAGKIAAVVTHLEMTERPALRPDPPGAWTLRKVETPDLTGYPVREAIQKIIALGLFVQLEGSGRVLRQEPPAGSIVPAGATVKVVLEPPL